MTGDSGQNLSELAAAYALGALEPEEARAFEAYLATSPDAQREVAEYREVGALLALGAGGGAVAAADLRTRVVEHATRQKVVSIDRRPNQAPWVAWGALAASLVAVAGLGLAQRGLRVQLAARDSTIATLQQSLDQRLAQLATREAELNSILDPSVSLTRMGTPGTPQPVVQLFWNRKTNLILAHAFQLPPLGAKRAYQLWFIPKNGKPIPSVTFNTEPSGHGMVQQIPVPQDVELSAAAITEEPEGGSPQPTSPIVVLGSFPPAKS